MDRTCWLEFSLTDTISVWRENLNAPPVEAIQWIRGQFRQKETRFVRRTSAYQFRAFSFSKADRSSRAAPDARFRTRAAALRRHACDDRRPASGPRACSCITF